MNSNYVPDHKKIEDQGPTFSLVLETENLGMAGIGDLQDTLESLQKQTYSVSYAKEVLIIAAGHISQDTLSFLAEKYPWVTVHRVDEKLEYVESKQRGAKIVTGDVVIFVDSDVVYESTWLENILYGFIAAPGAIIITGETRIRGKSLYSMAIQLSWMMNIVCKSSYPKHVSHFHLNNFAIKRLVFIKVPIFLKLPIYRAHTVEVKKWLLNHGYGVVRVPHARGYHLAPGNLADWWYRMLVFGADAIVKADFIFNFNGNVSEKFSPIKRVIRVPLFIAFKVYVMMSRTTVILQEDWKNIFKLIIAVPLAIFFVMVMTLGCLIAVVNRDYLFKKATARELVHVV